jgi:acyl-CoA thioester hydrolase
VAPLRAPFRSAQRVYFDDLDALNILHNVRYLLFIERARGELFNALGFHWQDDTSANPDKWHVIAEHSIRYVLPFRGEGEILIELRPSKLGRSSLVIDALAKSVHGDELYAEGWTRIVRLDPDTHKPCPWSDRFRAGLEPMLPKPT